jgi:fumarylacetoacetate (FAA) hydrolase family protein
VLRDTLARRWDRPHLLAPCDLQVLKACGVTFVRSMLERVIEERAAGEATRAAEIRKQIEDVAGSALSEVQPGSGGGAQGRPAGRGPVVAVPGGGHRPGCGGLHEGTGAVLGRGRCRDRVSAQLVVEQPGARAGARGNLDRSGCRRHLGNDVNLRDVEGRSALLLSKAKDNASCAIGPFVRLFDETSGLDHVRGLDIELTVRGADGFVLSGTSSMRKISRDPLQLVAARGTSTSTHGLHRNAVPPG